MRSFPAKNAEVTTYSTPWAAAADEEEVCALWWMDDLYTYIIYKDHPPQKKKWGGHTKTNIRGPNYSIYPNNIQMDSLLFTAMSRLYGGQDYKRTDGRTEWQYAILSLAGSQNLCQTIMYRWQFPSTSAFKAYCRCTQQPVNRSTSKLLDKTHIRERQNECPSLVALFWESFCMDGTYSWSKLFASLQVSSWNKYVICGRSF